MKKVLDHPIVLIISLIDILKTMIEYVILIITNTKKDIKMEFTIEAITGLTWFEFSVRMITFILLYYLYDLVMKHKKTAEENKLIIQKQIDYNNALGVTTE
jgi:hypothetical protein